MFNVLALLAQAATPLPADPLANFDSWREILLGSSGLTAWLIYDNIQLRRENAKLNQEARDMAKTSADALIRMATERKA